MNLELATHDRAATAEELAIGFRDQAYKLMTSHPIAAAHLVLAAATLAPTCRDEREVAEQFTYLVADFAQGLATIHHRARRRNQREAREQNNGAG